MNTVLWMIQIVLALVFLMAGSLKAFQPKTVIMARGLGVLEPFKEWHVTLIGVLELAAVAGLILPMALDILPVLTPLAAIGLILTMFVAGYTHYRKSEFPNIGVNVILGILALIVAFGRLVPEATAVI